MNDLNNSGVTHNTQSLKQGVSFNDKKNKNIKTGVETFQNMTDITNQTLKNNTYSNDEKNTNDANMNLNNKTIGDFNTLEKSVSDKTGNYYYRKDKSNPYLNKVISFSNGKLFYVTNQGIAKYISQDIKNKTLGKNGCTSTITKINIPWSSTYLNVGVVIPLSPTLITGSPLKSEQACGNEGNNLYVNSIVTSETSKYEGCYSDDLKHPLMTFIGGTPPEVLNIAASGMSSGIVNGNFTEPKINNNSYTYMNTSSGVPGWSEFYAVLVNSAGAWGYPQPYPKGFQCASLQCYPPWNQVHSISQVVNFDVGDYNLRFYTCGRNCCDGSGQSNPINVFLGNTLIYLNQPKFTWIEIVVPFTIKTAGKQKITFVCANKTYVDRSTAIQGVSIDNLKVIGESYIQVQDGVYDNSFCKQSAIDGGYKYYALQNVNPTTQKGYCAVSNNFVSATMNGPASKIGGVVSLWESKTNISGSIGSLTNRGTLSVVNPSGATIFNTPLSSNTSSDYIGCYVDKSSRAIPLYNGGSQTYNYDTCKDVAIKTSSQYFGLQNANSSGINAQCVTTNSLNSAMKYGQANNCKTISGLTVGSGWSNAMYTSELNNKYILTVEDNGNLTIHKGSNPSDKQELLWESTTGGKSQVANPLFVASKGKYANNWIVGGSTLAAGDFVGSPSGTAYLIMQSDGNLCLYTSLKSTTACLSLKNGTMGGDAGINALYSLDEVGNKSKVTNIMYVDENSSLYSYPSKNVNLTTDFTKMTNYVVTGNAISGSNGSCINSSIDNCKKKCNNNPKCYGFTYFSKDKNGWLKGKGMNPIASSPDMNYETYVKNRGVKEGFVGYTRPVTNISSVKLQNYINSKSNITNKKINSLSGKTLHEDDGMILDTETKMNDLSTTINDVNLSLKNKINNLNNQSLENSSTIPTYSKEYYDIINSQSLKLSNSINNINGIVSDSNIVVIHKSSMYIFWSIITIIMIIILIRIISMR